MNNSSDNWYPFKGIDLLDSPALVFYPQRIKENIRRLITMVEDVSLLRPHVKTSKTAEVAAMLLEAGIRKFKCATIAEAEMLAMSGAEDILLAYQPTQTKLQRLLQLAKRYANAQFSCLVDNLQSAALFSALCRSSGTRLTVYIDLNVGMNRTGIKPGEEAVELFESIAAMPHLQLAGFHAYDGHIRETDPQKRERACLESFGMVEQMRELLEKRGAGFPLLVAGGSPTFRIHATRRNVEVSPGTFVFWDKGYQETIPEQAFLPAALVITRVVSLPDETKICLDLGYKSIASENDLQRRVFFLNAPGLRPVSHSEEHLVMDAGERHEYQIGDVLYALPIHICPTVALYSHAVCVQDGSIGEEWTIIARDRKITC